METQNLSLRVQKCFRSEIFFPHEKINFVSPNGHVIITYIKFSQYIKFLAISPRFPNTLRRFPNIFHNLSKSYRRTFPNIFRRLPKKIQRYFDRAPKNVSAVKGTKMLSKKIINILTCGISFLSIYYHLVYH